MRACDEVRKLVPLPGPCQSAGLALRKQQSITQKQITKPLANKRIKKVGHNFKFDVQMLEEVGGFKVRGWTDDTMQLFFAVDENALTKNLDDAARRFVPEMAGYNDWFDYDKNEMNKVPLPKMLRYGCGDADATLRLYRTLIKELRKDERQYNCYRKIMMPALMAFAYVIERNGTMMDVRQLEQFGKKLVKHQHEEFKRLIKMIPGKVRRRHIQKGLKFSRTDFIRDALYSKDGFKLEVIGYTKSTASLEREKDRVPSTDKRTLAYHKEHPFVKGYLEWNQRSKLISTYINGMDQYLVDGKIYPVYWLSRTNTGRTASTERSRSSQTLSSRTTRVSIEGESA